MLMVISEKQTMCIREAFMLHPFAVHSASVVFWFSQNFPQKGRPLSSYLISSHFSHHQFPIGFVQDEAILEDPSR